MTWRRLRSGEIDHEALWLGVSLASAGLAWTWLTLDLPRPGCLFHTLTGWPCPTCGATRCVSHLLSGDFGAAVRMNPLCAALLAGLAVFDTYAAAILVARLPRLRFDTPALPLPLRYSAVIALVLNWAWLIHTGV